MPEPKHEERFLCEDCGEWFEDGDGAVHASWRNESFGRGFCRACWQDQEDESDRYEAGGENEGE